MIVRSRFLFLVAASALGGLLLSPVAWGHRENAAGERAVAAKRQLPTRLPDRLIRSWSDDPTSSMDITWRTSLCAGDPVVEYMPADLLVGNLRGELPLLQRSAGSSEKFVSDLGECRIHSTRLEELQSGTMYVYRVGDGEYFSEWFQFRTAASTPEPFTFVYFGDAQNDVRSWWSRVVREANQHAPRAAFMLHAGDLINSANSDAEWGEWFGAGSWLNGMIPSIACPGNHEYDDGLSHHWRPQFSFPLNGPPGAEETAYWIDYQGARIISLNSNEQIEAQRDWLRSVLEDENRPKWTFVTFHHPIFSAARDRDNPELRGQWRPVLEKYGVDLVLQGHDHAYARSGLGGPRNVNLSEGINRRESNTVYVVSVSGPKLYDLHETWDVSRVAKGRQLFQVIRVSPECVRYEARLATGELYDAFTLEKDAAGKTTLTEQIPNVPEAR